MAKTKAEVEAKVRDILWEQLGCALEDVKPEKKLDDDLGADSLDMIEIVMAVEDEFQPTFAHFIDEEEAAKWKTVQDVIDSATKLAGCVEA